MKSISSSQKSIKILHPLVNRHITMENHHAIHGKIHYKSTGSSICIDIARGYIIPNIHFIIPKYPLKSIKHPLNIIPNIHHPWQCRPCGPHGLILLREDPLPQAEGPPRGQRRQLAKAAQQLVKLEKVAVSGGIWRKLGGFIGMYPIP